MWYIYRITNNLNGHTYIGQHKYKKLDDNYMGSGKLLRFAYKKYGIENFSKEILYSRIRDRETADAMEIWMIKKERSIGKSEYNISGGGTGGNLGIPIWNKGKKLGPHTEEWRKKVSAATKGRKRGPMSEETKRKISETKKKNGVYISEEARRKISEGMKGKPKTEECKRKLSEAHKGIPSPYKGIPRSEEVKRKISETKRKTKSNKNITIIGE